MPYLLIHTIFKILYFAIILRCVFSWVQANPYNAFVQLVYQITEPILAPFRRLIPTRQFGIDLSPILVLFLMGIAEQLLLGLIY